MRALIVTLLAVLAVPASALAGGAPQNRSNPYAGLFVGQLGDMTPQKPPLPNLVLPPAPQYPLPKQTVICGLTVQQGDATLDSKMPQHPPSSAPKPIIGVIPAPACVK